MGSINNSKKIKAIIWDWNGTLLDDVAYSVNCINVLLRRRQMKTIDIVGYRKIFTFPVKKYYTLLGFDFLKEKWADVALEFMTEYWRNMDTLNLYTDAEEVLKYCKSHNIRQFIISAMEHEKLKNLVSDHGIAHYFDAVRGISNHFADGKTHLGNSVLKENGLMPDEVLWIGDTYHDFEVAASLGIRTKFVACGHQDKSVLVSTGCALYSKLSDIDFNKL